jgi:elongation factor Ts
MAVTAALVKELRERTGAGMMDCKKALTETNGDIEAAIENMRKNGQAKAAKKAGNIAAEGTIIIKEANGVAALVEVNCQTDFVAKDASFLAFANEVADAAVAEKLSIEALKEKFEETRVALVAKIGENMNVRRVEYIEGASLAAYRHGERIGVVVAGDADAETLKHVAMHVAASKPDYVNPEDVPADVVEKEKAVQVEIAMNEGKPAEIAEKMVVGRMKKFTGEISLTGQAFIMEPKKSVGDFLKEKNASVSTFVRLEVGEGIEKKEEDFAAEVAAQIAAAKGE